MTTEVAAFRWVPPFAQGFVRDLRIRWALEEAGLPYKAVLIDRATQKSEAYRAWQPFNQVPAYRDDTVEMFESGAVVLHIANQSEALAPADPVGRARVASWVFAALNSVETYTQYANELSDAPADETWARQRRERAFSILRHRLAALSDWLADKEYLEGHFTAGDLMMTTVLREIVDLAILPDFPAVDALRQRCEDRPAFGRALEAQMRPFREYAPA